MTLARRVVGVLSLDPQTFEDIEADKSASGQALVVVIAAGVSAGVGALYDDTAPGLFWVVLGKVIGCAMWAVVTYVLGARLWPEPTTKTDVGELFRVIGFSYVPDVFSIFGLLPSVGLAIRIVIALWQLATTVLAVRQALDYRSTWRALAVVATGWLIFFITPSIFQYVSAL